MCINAAAWRGTSILGVHVAGTGSEVKRNRRSSGRCLAGQWLTAETNRVCEGTECRFTFKPLTEAENPRARNMPGVPYRRTLKVQVSADRVLPAITGFEAAEQAPVTQLRDGTYAPYIPAEPNQRFRRFGPLGAAYYNRLWTGGAHDAPRLHP